MQLVKPVTLQAVSIPLPNLPSSSDLSMTAFGSEPELVRFVLEQLPLGLCVFDGQDRLRFGNDRFVQMWGLPRERVVPGVTFAEIMQLTPGSETERSRAQPHPLPGSAGTRRREWQLDNGRLIEVVVARLSDGSCVALHEDVTEQRGAQARIRHLALHDALTGLANRPHLHEVLQARLARQPELGPLALLCLDLDRFKFVNDTHGHPVGDLLLQAVAARLRQTSRATDLVVRMGGDEFAVLQCDVPQPQASTALAQRLIDVLAQPFELAGHVLHIGASVGIAMAPDDGHEAETLHKHADLALYRAKALGKGTWCCFEPGIDHEIRARRAMEADLRGALARDELVLEYQPQVAMADNRVAGFEALLRWRHPQRGLVSPADFIPLAEETGLINEIGRWVLLQACHEARHWPADVRVAVNVSAVQFRCGTLTGDVERALQASGLASTRLEIELTESVMQDDMQGTAATLRAIKALGVAVAIDDFGTGYSSLSLLRSFPFDRIKIDRSFVRDLGERHDALPIIRAVVTVCSSLNLAITVEGVETGLQLQTVRDEGCTEVQGFYYSRPVPAAAIATLLHRLLTDATACDGAAPAPSVRVCAHAPAPVMPLGF